jgi:hypothetical protein
MTSSVIYQSLEETVDQMKYYGFLCNYIYPQAAFTFLAGTMVGLAVEGLSSSMDSTATFHLYVTKGFWN